MQINVAQQLKGPIGAVRNYRVSETMDIAGGSSQIEGEVMLMRTDRGILAKGILHTEIELSCCRCLSLFSYPLTLDIEEEYFPTTNVVTDAPLPLPDEPDHFTIDEYNVLDLTEAIRQYALLATPMKPLCRDDCAGLCPTCGCNLNQTSCNCPPHPADPRWSALGRLVSVNNRALVNE
ncbi:DUF177 domain-containing protein [Chloroflexota bacterium]